MEKEFRYSKFFISSLHLVPISAILSKIIIYYVGCHLFDCSGFFGVKLSLLKEFQYWFFSHMAFLYWGIYFSIVLVYGATFIIITWSNRSLANYIFGGLLIFIPMLLFDMSKYHMDRFYTQTACLLAWVSLCFLMRKKVSLLLQAIAIILAVSSGFIMVSSLFRYAHVLTESLYGIVTGLVFWTHQHSHLYLKKFSTNKLAPSYERNEK